MWRKKWVPAVVIGLTACGPAASDETAADTGPTRAPASEPAASTSIIRPDVLPEADVAPPPLEATIPFGEGGAELSEQAERALADVLQSEQIAQGWPIVLRGHTDSVGRDEANLRTSRRRAETVAEWLTARGVDAQRIAIIALGEQRPVAPNALPDGTPDEAGRARNRRVTISVAPPLPDVVPEAEPAVDAVTEPEPARGG